MKILIAFYKIMDYGGIINNQENLVKGLRDLGHDVTTKFLVWKESYSPKGESSRDTEKGEMGLEYSQHHGWVLTKESIFAYKGRDRVKEWKDFASKFDLVIWQIPVPSASKENAGNSDWLDLYDLPKSVKQIAYIHDGNFLQGYPWLHAISHRLCGVVGVHPCAYHSLSALAVPRAMAFSPQKDMEKRLSNTDVSKRKGWLSVQTFKGWKHVPDLVAAVPFMKRSEPMLLAGTGIDYHYLTSQDKCKYPGIWDKALSHGMEYLGVIPNQERDKILGNARCLIDPSWSKKYAKIGDHFNRVVIEGLIRGVVPIARNLGVSTNEEGKGEFFTPGRNYIMIPWDASPKEFASIVDHACNLPKAEHEAMVYQGRRMLRWFDYRFTASTFLDMAKGKDTVGVYEKLETGKESEDLKQSSDKYLEEFFRVDKTQRATTKKRIIYILPR
jgi:hypothetical protein